MWNCPLEGSTLNPFSIHSKPVPVTGFSLKQFVVYGLKGKSWLCFIEIKQLGSH